MADVAIKDKTVAVLALDDKVLFSDTSDSGATKNAIGVPVLTTAQTTAGGVNVPALTSSNVLLGADGNPLPISLSSNTVVAMSDSIGVAGGIAANTMSFFEYCALSSNGAMKLLANLSVNAAKTADIISVQLPLALASSAKYVLVMEAANDAFNSVSVSTHRQNMAAILSAVSAAGKELIFVGAPPANGYNITQYNLADSELARAAGKRYVNPWAAVATNGQWRDGTFSLDGVHPYPKASRIAGAALWAALQPLFTGTPDLAWSDEEGMLSNCLNLTNVSGVPTGWTGAAGVTHSCAEAGTGDVAGNWWKMTATNITAWQVSSRGDVPLPSGWVPGDTVVFSARIRTVGVEANGGAGNGTASAQGNMGGYISLSWTGGSGALTLREVDADVSGVVSVYGTIPTGCTGANLVAVITQFATVSGEFSIAQMQVLNLSLAARK